MDELAKFVNVMCIKVQVTLLLPDCPSLFAPTNESHARYLDRARTPGSHLSPSQNNELSSHPKSMHNNPRYAFNSYFLCLSLKP